MMPAVRRVLSSPCSQCHDFSPPKCPPKSRIGDPIHKKNVAWGESIRKATKRIKRKLGLFHRHKVNGCERLRKACEGAMKPSPSPPKAYSQASAAAQIDART